MSQISGSFNSHGIGGYFWSSSQFSTSYAWGRYLHFNYANVSRDYNYKGYGRSVGCLKD